MSTTHSIANFYVDENGVEQPIRYRAEDLVNKRAPKGYHWERDLREYNRQREIVREENERRKANMKIPDTEDRNDLLVFRYLPYPNFPNPIYYIAVRNGEPNDTQT